MFRDTLIRRVYLLIMQMCLKEKTRLSFNCCGHGTPWSNLLPEKLTVTKLLVSSLPLTESAATQMCLQVSKLCVAFGKIFRLIPDKPPSQGPLYRRRPLLSTPHPRGSLDTSGGRLLLPHPEDERCCSDNCQQWILLWTTTTAHYWHTESECRRRRAKLET